MAIRFSQGLRNSLLGNAVLKGTSLAYVDGGVGDDSITDSEDRFIEAGFKVGDTITTTGSDTPGNNFSVALTGVTKDTLSFATTTVDTPEDFLAATAVTSNNGKALKELLTNGVLGLYSDSQPASSNDIENGSLLVLLTKDGGAFAGGSPTNGLNFEGISEGKLSKNGDTWKGVGIAAGTIGWGRFFDNKYTIGASENAVRFDGVAGVGTGEFKLSSSTVEVDLPIICQKLDITFPSRE